MTGKCKSKDCNGCVHFVDIQKHPLFAGFQIQSGDNKPFIFEGCIFHLLTFFQFQAWMRLEGTQSAIESGRNETVKAIKEFTFYMGQVDLKRISG